MKVYATTDDTKYEPVEVDKRYEDAITIILSKYGGNTAEYCEDYADCDCKCCNLDTRGELCYIRQLTNRDQCGGDDDVTLHMIRSKKIRLNV